MRCPPVQPGIGKDAWLSICGKLSVILMIPGIDFAGTVHASEDPRFHAGRSARLPWLGRGRNHWEAVRRTRTLKRDWLVAARGRSKP